jgi:hypothetical protein
MQSGGAVRESLLPFADTTVIDSSSTVAQEKISASEQTPLLQMAMWGAVYTSNQWVMTFLERTLDCLDPSN